MFLKWWNPFPKTFFFLFWLLFFLNTNKFIFTIFCRAVLYCPIQHRSGIHHHQRTHILSEKKRGAKGKERTNKQTKTCYQEGNFTSIFHFQDMAQVRSIELQCLRKPQSCVVSLSLTLKWRGVCSRDKEDTKKVRTNMQKGEEDECDYLPKGMCVTKIKRKIW